ncbi:hypothetical protein [Nocardia sp. CY41]|uniref:hypothetical protein n=1 Tax=Nocardia sp. CY41 TaxID=2608686 RepID=UPI00135BD59B|nr:hypothetical protein [Nocardia sp. CY41]
MSTSNDFTSNSEAGQRIPTDIDAPEVAVDGLSDDGNPIPIRHSPAVQKAFEEWARGYTPTIAAQRHFKSLFRTAFTLAVERLLERSEEADELELLELYRELGEYLERRDAQLRTDLAGDRWVDTGRAAA